MTAPSPAWNRNFHRRSGDEPSVVAELPQRHIALQIGCRWSTGHEIHRDPVTGSYEERNPPMGSEAEQVQAALLSTPRGNGWGWWVAACVLFPATYIFCRVMWP